MQVFETIYALVPAGLAVGKVRLNWRAAQPSLEKTSRFLESTNKSVVSSAHKIEAVIFNPAMNAREISPHCTSNDLPKKILITQMKIANLDLLMNAL